MPTSETMKMKFNFNEMINIGHSEADIALSNKYEIKEVFDELQYSICEYAGVKINFFEKEEYEDGMQIPIAMTIFDGRANRKLTGYKILSLGSDRSYRDFFKYKESERGYPVSIDFLNNKYLSTNQQELGDSIASILSTPQANFIIRDVIERIKTIK